MEIDLSDKTALSGQATWFTLQAPPPESNHILEDRLFQFGLLFYFMLSLSFWRENIRWFIDLEIVAIIIIQLKNPWIYPFDSFSIEQVFVSGI